MENLKRLLANFFPSWNLFGNSGQILILEYRFRVLDYHWSPWRVAVSQVQRSWINLIWNPKGNFYHYLNSSVQRLVEDSAKDGVLDQKIILSHPIHEEINKFILSLLQENSPTKQSIQRQWRILITNSPQTEHSELFLSKPEPPDAGRYP